MAALRIKGFIYVIGLMSGAFICFCLLSVHPIKYSFNRSDPQVIHSEGGRVSRSEDKMAGLAQPNRKDGDDKLHNSDDERLGANDKNKNGSLAAFHDEGHHDHDHGEVAQQLYEKVRVLCWIMTSPENHKKKAVHVLATWGRRCNKILFVSEEIDSNLPVIKVDVKHGREHLTAKTMAAFDQIYEHHRDDADWFLKADDDTFVIMENLRYFLSSQNPNASVYFGHHFHLYVRQGYPSGGGGYVLSREALSRFGQRQAGSCTMDQGAEDVEIGRCMEKLGVKIGDSRDNMGRSRFHCFHPEAHVHGTFPDWYKLYDKYGAKKGIESISDYAITFHYISVEQMYNLEFYIYHLRPYGIVSGLQNLNIPIGAQEDDEREELPSAADIRALEARLRRVQPDPRRKTKEPAVNVLATPLEPMHVFDQVNPDSAKEEAVMVTEAITTASKNVARRAKRKRRTTPVHLAHDDEQ